MVFLRSGGRISGWDRLRRPQALKIRGLLEEHFQPTTANRMLTALRGVLKECWHAQLMIEPSTTVYRLNHDEPNAARPP